MGNINLRDAVANDELLVFEWRNIDTLVALSYNQKKVSLLEHQQWFDRSINDPNCNILIIQLEDKDIGLIRLELEQGECEITIYLIPGYEGQGFGYIALSKAIDNCTINCSRHEYA